MVNIGRGRRRDLVNEDGGRGEKERLGKFREERGRRERERRGRGGGRMYARDKQIPSTPPIPPIWGLTKKWRCWKMAAYNYNQEKTYFVLENQRGY